MDSPTIRQGTRLFLRKAAKECTESKYWRPAFASLFLSTFGLLIHFIISPDAREPMAELKIAIIYGVIPVVAYFSVFYVWNLIKVMVQTDLAKVPRSEWDDMIRLPLVRARDHRPQVEQSGRQAREGINKGAIACKEETRGDVMGVAIRNTGVRALERLSMYAADFSEWSPDERAFLEKSEPARLGRSTIRPASNLEPSNDYSEFLPIIFTGKTDALCIICRQPGRSSTEVVHDIKQPGIYRIVIERALGSAKAEPLTEVFVKWDKGRTPEFTSNPSLHNGTTAAQRETV